MKKATLVPGKWAYYATKNNLDAAAKYAKRQAEINKMQKEGLAKIKLNTKIN